MVESVPECPVFKACNKSNASPPRTSPTRMRSGRWRRVARTKSRMVTAGTSGWARRASNRTRLGASSCSSAVSSMTTSRSSDGRPATRALRSVVFPVPVPPVISMLSRASIASCMIRSWPAVTVPVRTSSSAVKKRPWNLRMVKVVPPRLTGGKAAATRDPSGRRESSKGCSSEMSSPRARARFRTATRRLCSRTVTSGTASMRPSRSTNTAPEPFTMTSVTAGSRIQASMGRRNGRITSKLMSQYLLGWRRTGLGHNRLVVAEVGNRQAEGIDRNAGVRHVVVEDEHEVGDVGLAAHFGPRARSEVHLIKLHCRPIRGLPEIVERHVPYVDLDLLGGAGQEPLDGAGFFVGFHRGVRQPPVEEIERLGVVLADGRADAAVMRGDELHEEVLELGGL